MATITAKGITNHGYQEIQITGEKRVESIVCSDGAFMMFVETSINKARGQMANGYVPPARTMLQALAVLTMLYDYRNVTVDGDIGEMPHQPGVIY